MKKKVMSEEALKKLYAEEESTGETSAEETASAGEATGGEDAAAAADAQAAQDAQSAQESSEENTEDEVTIESLTAAHTEAIENLNAEHKDSTQVLEDKLTDMEAAHAEESQGLKDIVVTQISKMRIALQIAAVDMSDWKVEAVITEFDSVKDSFMKALPVGSVIPKKEDVEKEAAVMNSHDASSFKALGF